jgi:uncharacterized protein DUF1214
VNVYFGPKAPAGKETDWIQTMPGKGWNTLLRLYSPLEPWFDKLWYEGIFRGRDFTSVSQVGNFVWPNLKGHRGWIPDDYETNLS